MASIKLNSDMRTALCKEIIGDKYDKLREQLNKDWTSWHEEAALLVYPVELRKQIQKLPENWFPIANRISAAWGGQYESIKLMPSLPLPRFLDSDTQRFAGDHPLTEKRQELYNRKSDIENQEKKDKAEIMSVLNSVTTTGRLREVWPEINSLIDKHCHKIVIVGGLPAIPVDHLNAKFNLPKEKTT